MCILYCSQFHIELCGLELLYESWDVDLADGQMKRRGALCDLLALLLGGTGGTAGAAGAGADEFMTAAVRQQASP